MADWDPHGIQRRVAGKHDIRLDGISDLLLRAHGAAVMDLGCNRGAVGLEFAHNGAAVVHGCDYYELGVTVAREMFADLRYVSSQFEVCDLTQGPPALRKFGEQRYNILLMLATYHKIKREMDAKLLRELIVHLGNRTAKFFAWRGTEHQDDENMKELNALDEALGTCRLKRIHTTYLSDLGPAAIWAR